MRYQKERDDGRELNRVLEAFAENHPVPPARDIIDLKNLHPEYAEEIVELAALLLEASLHRGREEDHVVDAEDLRVVERAFAKTGRDLSRTLGR